MKKIMARITALVLVMGMLTACGGTTSTSQGSAASEGASGDATVIEVWSNNRHDEVYMTEMIEKFNASQSDVQIEYTILTDDWLNSIQLAFQANTAPDIITVAASDNLTLSDYVAGGMLNSLSPYIEADTEFQKVTEAYDHMYEGLNSLGEEIYWVPNGVRSGSRLQYNTELMSAAGYDAIPATFGELVQACKTVTEQGGGSSYGVGFTSSSPLSRWIEGIAEMSGATHKGYDFVNGVYDFTSWKPVIETAAQLFADGSVLPGSETQGVDNSRALFAEGAFAVWGNASQEAGVFTDQFPPKFEWAVAELPTMEGTVKGALNCTPNFGFAMLSSCENPDAAWKVIQYFSSEEFMKGYLEGGYTLPLSSYMTGKIDSSKTGRLSDFAMTDYEDVYPTPPAVSIEGDDYLVTLWNAVLGNVPVDEAIEDLNTRYNDALERGLSNGSCKRIVIADFDPMNPSAGTPTYETE